MFRTDPFSVIYAFAGSPEKVVPLFRLRSRVHISFGEWKYAALDYSKLLELQPQVFAWHHGLSLLLLQSGDIEGYQRQCKLALAAFDETSDPGTASRLAMNCLLFPAFDSDLEAAIKLAEAALAVDTNHIFFQLTEGLAEYRRQHFSVALELMQRVVIRGGAMNEPDNVVAGPTVAVGRHVGAVAILAMAQFQIGRHSEANAALSEGKTIASTKMPKAGESDLGDGWYEWVIAHALLREASALIVARQAKSGGVYLDIYGVGAEAGR